jgi:protein phosphatase 1 regulatory subunit 37
LERSHEALEEDEWWSMDKVESFYRECFEGCGDTPDPAVAAALKVGALLFSAT